MYFHVKNVQHEYEINMIEKGSFSLDTVSWVDLIEIGFIWAHCVVITFCLDKIQGLPEQGEHKILYSPKRFTEN